MRRVAAWLAALVIALLGWLQVATPVAVAVTQPLTIHTCDSPMNGTPSAYTESQRGPPTNHDHAARVNTVDGTARAS